MKTYPQAVACVLFLLLLLPCVSLAQEAKTKCDILVEDYAATAKQYDERHDRKLIKPMLEKAKAIEAYASARYTEAEETRSYSEYLSDIARIHYVYCAPRGLNALLDTAKAHMDAGVFDVSKQLYRGIITDYPGSDWKPYVKKAEFGLEDLKEAQAQRKGKTKK